MNALIYRVKWMFMFTATALLIVFSGCEYIGEEVEEGVYQTYTIEAGNHYSNEKLPETFTTTHFKFSVVFDSTAVYATSNSSNQGDVNKLYGFSDCGNPDHHVNSARYGWRYYEGNLQLFAYTYKNGERTETFMKNIDIDTEYICHIELIGNTYLFSIDGHDSTVELERGCAGESPELTKLYPFFGGDEPAPHQITIDVMDLTSDVVDEDDVEDDITSDSTTVEAIQEEVESDEEIEE